MKILRIFLAIFAFSLLMAAAKSPVRAPAQLPVYGEVPDFSLIEKSGRPVGASDLKGRVWIADFIFTHCAGPCPLMSSRMSQLQQKWAENPKMGFLSFSVDPDRDSPAVLNKYAERYGAKEGWLFLTGDKKQIYDLISRNFHLGVGDVPAEERDAVDQMVRHSTKFVLLDRDLRIRGYYDSDNPQAMGQLEKDAANLLSE